MRDLDLSNLLVIRERDVGLFSTTLQVLNTLYLLEDRQIDRVPIVLLGSGLIYFQGDGYAGRQNVWEYYFEPVVEGLGETRLLPILGRRAFDLLESKRKELELARGALDFPEDLHLVPDLDAEDRTNLADLTTRSAGLDWAWTEAFQPTIDGHGPVSAVPHQEGVDLLRRYIRPRRHILERANRFYDDHLAGHHVIGVHVRGTDGHSAPARGVAIPFDRYFDEIERRMKAVGPEACRVFLATDEAALIAPFEERFGGSLVYCETVRKVDGDEIFGTGPTGQEVPGYIAKGGITAAKNGDDAVLEFELLRRSDILVHNVSSLSLAASYGVPESILV